ncbi:MAG: aminotransferase class I/II-fold pyridoxal phosphate-dependent enzyme [Acidobacteriota bacterium]|nr:aminotransferase class I/II-fold pyridoxal phosphate-dependent enzyme [Acidobacteriota bacterium]
MAYIREMSEVAPASRIANVRYAIRDIATLGDDLVRQGKTIIPLHIGDPLAFDFETPPHMIEAVARAMRNGKNGYAPSLGVGEALDAIRASAARDGIRGIQTAFVTYGVSEAADICLTGLLNPGDSVLAPSPEYPLYSAILAKLGVESTYYHLDEENGWEPDLDDLASKVGAKTRAVVVINPNNPTGAIYSRKTLEGIAEIARQHRLVVFSDEIYEKLLLDGGTHTPFAPLAPDLPVVTFKGLSKGYLVPGWRVGWAVVSGPEGALKGYVQALHQLVRARLSGNNPMQYAIRPALEGPQDHLAGVLRKLRARRDLTVELCQRTPRISCVPPRAAFYAFPRLDIPTADVEFVRGLLMEKLVLVVHGSGFGPLGSNGHFRIVYLADEQTLSRAYQGIAEFIEEHYS